MIFRSSVRLVPSSVADWLRAELESREIDAPLYARCLLSILQREDSCLCDSGVIGDSLEDQFGFWDRFTQLGGPKKSLLALGHTKLNNQFYSKSKDRSGRSRQKKNRSRRGTGEGGCQGSVPDKQLFKQSQYFNMSRMWDGEQMKKSAAVDCLSTACDKKIEAEQLVEELWNKLRESEDIIQKADSLESSPDRASETAPNLSDEGYRHAFPPLDACSDAQLRNSDVKWPSVTKAKEQEKPRVPFIFRAGAYKSDKRKTEHFVASDGYDGDISSRESSKDRRKMKNYYYDLKQGQKPLHSSSKFLPLFKSNTNVTEEACGNDLELPASAADSSVADLTALEESFMSLLKLQEVDPKLNEIEAKFTAAIANIWKNDDRLHIKAEVRAVRFPLNSAFQGDPADIINANVEDVTVEAAPRVMPPPGFENFAIYSDEVDSAPYGQSRFKDFFVGEDPAPNIFDFKLVEEEKNMKNLEEEPWQLEENGNLKPSLSSQSLMEESLAMLNHSREESCFAEVTPTLFKTPSSCFEPIPESTPCYPDDAAVDANYQGLLELLSKSASEEGAEKGEEGECLLTSTKTHFIPIKEECAESFQDRYEDGATFDVASTLDEVSYLRSQSGTLILPGEDYGRYMVYRESKIPVAVEKPHTPDAADVFPLKFKVKETEKFCQTDLDPPVAYSSRCETPTESVIDNLNFARLYDAFYVPEVEREDYMRHRVWTSESANDPWVQEDSVNKEVELENEAAEEDKTKEDQDGENLLAEIWTALSGESDNDEDQGIGHSEENFDYSYDVYAEGANVWESAVLPEGYEAWSYGENLGDDFYEHGWLPGQEANYGQEVQGEEHWPPAHIPVEYLDDELFDEIFGVIHNNPGTGESEGGSKKTSSQSKKKKKSGEKWKNKRRRHGSYHRPCMYFVEGECRRADCQFSHDLGAIPCRFWLEGGCFKAESCPFRHGFPAHPDSADHSEAEKGFELESESDFPMLGVSSELTGSVKGSEPRPIPKSKAAANSSVLPQGKKQKQRSRRFTAAEIIGSAASTSENATPRTSERRRKNRKKASDEAQTAQPRRRRAVSEREVAPA